MRKLATINFGPYLPDQPDLGNQGLEVARNVLPRERGYDSLPSLLDYDTDRLPARPVGAFSVRDENDLPYLFAGTVTATLHQLASKAWTDVSRVSPAYSPATRWEFAKFGKTALAASIDNEIQAITLGSSNFADLTTSNVQGATLATLRGFVVVGDVKDDDGHSPYRVRWSPLDDPAGDWTPDPTTQAGFNDLRTNGGRIVRAVGGEYGLVFRERSLYRMTYTGASPLFWQFDEIDPGIGAIAAGSVIQQGARVFFLSEDGVRMTVGDASRPVGEERIDQEFIADLDQSHLGRISGAVYTNEQIIVWAYPGANNIGGQPNRLLIYNFGTDRWATGDEAVEVLFRAATPFRSIDDFDDNPTFGGTQSPPLYDSIDDIPGSLDDPQWSGGAFQIGALTGDPAGSDLAFYTGPPRPGQFESGELQHIEGQKSVVTEMRSLVNDAGSVEVEIGHRNEQRKPVVWTTPVSSSREGIIPARVSDRYMRYRVTCRDGFKDAVGLDVYGDAAGGR